MRLKSLMKILLSSVLLISVGMLSGCGEPGYLSKLEGKRLCVVLNTEKGSERVLETSLVNLISRRTKLEVIGSNALGMPKLSEDKPHYKKLREKYALDYVLFVELNDVSVTPVAISITNKGVGANIQGQCSLNMVYRIVDLSTEEVVLVGQQNGNSDDDSNTIEVGDEGLNINLADLNSNENKAIRKAMFNAVGKTKLL